MESKPCAALWDCSLCGPAQHRSRHGDGKRTGHAKIIPERGEFSSVVGTRSIWYRRQVSMADHLLDGMRSYL